MRKGKVLSLVISVLGVAIFGALPAQPEPSQPQVGPLLQALAIDASPKPFPAPSFTLPDLDGTSVELARFHGRVVMLYFWTTY